MIGRKDWYNLILFMPLVLVLLLYSHETLDPVLHIRFLGGYLYLFFLGLFFARKKSMRCFRIDKWFLIFFAGYLITSMLSLFFYYKNVGEGIFEWYRLLMPLLVVCLLQSFIERETDISDHVALVFISCLVIAAIVGFYQYYILYTTSIINHNSIYKVSSLFAHKNIFAEVMLICFPFGIYYFVSGKGPVKYIGLLTSAISLFFITILLSRAIWVAFVLAGVISLVFLFFINRKEGKLFLNVKKVGVMAILLLLMIGFSVYIFSQQDTAVTFYKQFTSTFNFSHDSTKDRIELWKKSILIFKENPWIGKGLGSWKVEILKYGNLELKSIDNVTFYQRPHNDFVWILAEQGLLAFIFYLSIPGLLYYYMFRLLKREISFKEKSFILAVLYALTAFLLFSLFSFPRERIEHVVFFSLLCFSVVQLHNKYATPSCNFTLAQNKMFIVLSPLIVLGLCIAFIRFNSEVHNKKAFVARQQLNWELLKQEIDASDNFFYRFDPTSTPLLWYKGMANFNERNIKGALANFEEAYKVNPYHPYVLSNIGTCHEFLGAHEKALFFYDKAIKAYPRFEDALFNSAAIYYNLGKAEEAYQVLRQVDTKSISPKYTQYAEVLVKPKFGIMRDTLTDENLKRVVSSMYNTQQWWLDEFKKSVNTNRSLEKQVGIDIVWFFENSEKNDTLAQRLKKTTHLW